MHCYYISWNGFHRQSGPKCRHKVRHIPHTKFSVICMKSKYVYKFCIHMCGLTVHPLLTLVLPKNASFIDNVFDVIRSMHTYSFEYYQVLGEIGRRRTRHRNKQLFEMNLKKRNEKTMRNLTYKSFRVMVTYLDI